jgi:hypothetical protein
VKGILEFNLPEESGEFEDAINAPKYRAALFETRQQVFRPARKHGYGRHDIHVLLTRLDELVRDYHADQASWPTDEYGHPQDGTHLVSMLEGLFSQILEENGVGE